MKTTNLLRILGAASCLTLANCAVWPYENSHEAAQRDGEGYSLDNPATGSRYMAGADNTTATTTTTALVIAMLAAATPGAGERGRNPPPGPPPKPPGGPGGAGSSFSREAVSVFSSREPFLSLSSSAKSFFAAARLSSVESLPSLFVSAASTMGLTRNEPGPKPPGRPTGPPKHTRAAASHPA